MPTWKTMPATFPGRESTGHSKRIGRSNCPGAPYDGAEAAQYAQRAKDVNSKCAVAYLLSGDVALKTK